jgi:cytochrome-b5 reductase
MDAVKIGDKIKVKGPKGNFIYSSTLAPHLSMIAGGTGITPMLQIITLVQSHSLEPKRSR